MSDGGANNCTIELVHGGSVHVIHTSDEIQHMISETHRLGQQSRRVGFIRVQRSTSHASRTSRGFPEIDLAVAHIVGIFPLISRSEPRVRDE